MSRDLCVLTKTCRWHSADRRSYLEWHDWAERQAKAGRRQRKCPDCGRLFFREEWGAKPPRGKSWRLAR